MERGARQWGGSNGAGGRRLSKVSRGGLNSKYCTASGEHNIFKPQRADAFYKSICPCVCLSVCPCVRVFIFEVPFKRLFAPTS